MRLNVCILMWHRWDELRKLLLRYWEANSVYRTFPYLVLWEHFVHFLPSHVSNAPQPSQISIAALILTVISRRDGCRHFISCSPRSASLSLILAQFLSLSLSLSAHSGSSFVSPSKIYTELSLFLHTGKHTHIFQAAPSLRIARCDESLVN